MRFNFTILLTAFIFLFSCKNAPVKISTDIVKEEYLIDIENENYKIEIKDINQKDSKGFSGSYHTEPYLGIRAECISLGDLIGIIMKDKNSFLLESQDFYANFYSVLIEQRTSGNENDSIIKDKILNAFNLIQENKTFKVDTVVLAIKEQPQSIKDLDRPALDTLKINYYFSQNVVEFEDFKLEEKLFRAKYIDYRNVVLIIESPITSKIGLVENGWTTKQTNLGYELEYVSKSKTLQKEKLSIRKNYLVKN